METLEKNYEIVRKHQKTNIDFAVDSIDEIISKEIKKAYGGGFFGGLISGAAAIFIDKEKLREDLYESFLENLDAAKDLSNKDDLHPYKEKVRKLTEKMLGEMERSIGKMTSARVHVHDEETIRLGRAVKEKTLENYIRLLESEGDSYEELVRNAYPSKKEFVEGLEDLFEYYEEFVGAVTDKIDSRRKRRLIRGVFTRLAKIVLEREKQEADDFYRV